MTVELTLSGCFPDVLASYLKGLAVHRLVAEQADADAVTWWDSNGVLHLGSRLDREELIGFFAERYAPSPILTPWNGGSGFYTGDQRAGIDAIEQSADPRLLAYRRGIAASRALLERLGIRAKPAEEAKTQLLRQARSTLPDAMLPWLDAAYAVSAEPSYPALLGSGGNDGRLDFANNFMQRVSEALLSVRGVARTRPQIAAALFGEVVADARVRAAVGQFAPATAGGPNMTTGLDAEATVNPWDYMLSIEGALTFAGAAVRRLESDSAARASFPFHVAASSVGQGSLADDDERKGRSTEIWLPLWPRPATAAEIRHLFGEGRLTLGRRRARNGIEAARALASFGVDRGIDRFHRIAILQRNGLSHLATSLGTIEVHSSDSVGLLEALDPFVESLRRLSNASDDISRGVRRVREGMFDAAKKRGPLTEVLAAVGALELALSRSPAARKTCRPLRTLPPAWHAAADDGSVEFQVAAAVASWQIRPLLESVDERDAWSEGRPLWTAADPLGSVVRIAIARLRSTATDGQRYPLDGPAVVTPGALRALLNGVLDRRKFGDLLLGLSVVARPAFRAPMPDLRLGAPLADTTFAVLRAVTSPVMLAAHAQRETHPAPLVVVQILNRLLAGDVDEALTIAGRRLRAHRFTVSVPTHSLCPRRDTIALATALVVPVPRSLEAEAVGPAVALPAEEEGEAS